MNIIDELEWRGAVNQQTDEEGLRKLVEEKKISLYCGVDPTGDSMHIGHLIPFMMMKRFQLAGHHPVILIGGATGTIGDPSGRQSERQLQTLEVVQHNVDALTAQMKKLFDFGGNSEVKMVNNYDWTHEINIIEFLRDYGKNFSINSMLAKRHRSKSFRYRNFFHRIYVPNLASDGLPSFIHERRCSTTNWW